MEMGASRERLNRKGSSSTTFSFLILVLVSRSRSRSRSRRRRVDRVVRGFVGRRKSAKIRGSWSTRVVFRRSRGWNLVSLTHDDSNCSSLSTRNSPSTVYSTLFFHFNSVRGLKSLYSGGTKEETNEMGIQFFVPRRRYRRSRSSATRTRFTDV